MQVATCILQPIPVLLPQLSILFGLVPKRGAGLYFIAAAFKKQKEKFPKQKRKNLQFFLKTWKKCYLNSEGQFITNGLCRGRGRGVKRGKASNNREGKYVKKKK